MFSGRVSVYIKHWGVETGFPEADLTARCSLAEPSFHFPSLWLGQLMSFKQTIKGKNFTGQRSKSGLDFVPKLVLGLSVYFVYWSRASPCSLISKLLGSRSPA